MRHILSCVALSLAIGCGSEQLEPAQIYLSTPKPNVTVTLPDTIAFDSKNPKVLVTATSIDVHENGDGLLYFVAEGVITNNLTVPVIVSDVNIWVTTDLGRERIYEDYLLLPEKISSGQSAKYFFSTQPFPWSKRITYSVEFLIKEA